MTGNDLFIMSLDLLGLRENAFSLPSDTADLKNKALSLINITLAENSELDCRIRRTEHKVIKINTLDDIIDCSEIVAVSVLPYGVARLLALGEDDALCADLNRLYGEAKLKAIGFGKAKAEPIKEVYS
ncbi:MAG: hypothetical protein J6Q89_03920 [Clostridia bacterium]|nr:hypothetical protein [Clostridia bacterium]